MSQQRERCSSNRFIVGSSPATRSKIRPELLGGQHLAVFVGLQQGGQQVIARILAPSCDRVPEAVLGDSGLYWAGFPYWSFPELCMNVNWVNSFYVGSIYLEKDLAVK
jgi:hypothetical protein